MCIMEHMLNTWIHQHLDEDVVFHNTCKYWFWWFKAGDVSDWLCSGTLRKLKADLQGLYIVKIRHRRKNSRSSWSSNNFETIAWDRKNTEARKVDTVWIRKQPVISIHAFRFLLDNVRIFCGKLLPVTENRLCIINIRIRR